MNDKRIIKNMRWLSGLILLAMLAVFSACRDNLVPEKGVSYWDGDGSLVNITMSIDAPLMEVRTRAVLPEERERQVEDLFVLMFKLDSSTDTNPKVVNSSDQRYFTRDQIREATPEAIHSTGGLVELKNIPTGTYYIAAVANIMYGDADSQRLLTDLKAVDDFQKFQALKVHLAEKDNLSRTYLCMSGYFMSDDKGSEATHENVHINPDVPHAGIIPEKIIFNKSGQLNGYIHLRRLDSQIHFNIKQEIPNVENFEVLSWKVVNIPSFASAIEEEHDLCTNSDDFSEFGPNISGWTKNEGMNGYELDFYMLENRGVSKNPITEYGKRELETKTAGGLNSDKPNYVNAPANAAYLELEVKFQQQMPDSKDATFLRDVTAKYIIHLGYCEALQAQGNTGTAHKANDFNSRRNIKYTYNVVIRGAEEIVIEANSTDLDDELFNHGTEGTVIDVNGGQLIDLDAHYGVFNITLTRDELAHSHFVIESPNGYWSTVGKSIGEDGYPDPWTEDFQHIRVAYNEAGTQQLLNGQPVTKLVSYSKTYDHDCPAGTVISEIDEASHTLIPVHHEKKQIQDANHIYPLYDMYCLGKEYGSPYHAQNNPNGYTDDNKNKPLVFTVFVNEFYYYYPGGTISKTEKYGNDGYVTSGTETQRDYTLWHDFANYTKGRSYMLLTDFRDSKDNESHHLLVKIHVHQRAIQTFYDQKLNQSVVGLEQINEHHYKNLSGYYWRDNRGKNGNTDMRNDVGGWYRTNYWLSRPTTFESKKVNEWNTHVDQETIQGSNDGHTYPIFASKSVQTQFGAATSYDYKRGFGTDNHNYEIIDVAATRNRDLNRDGEITSDEVRWFAPSTFEYVTFAVGAGALQTPLFDKTQFDPNKTYWNANDNGHWSTNFKKVYYNGVFHFLGTDSWYLVSEEGASIGQADYENNVAMGPNWATGLHTQYAGEVRCARYMGVPNGDNGYDGLTLPDPATYNPVNNVFTTTNFSYQLRRKPTSGSLPFHDNLNVGNNGYNSFADYFQMASADAGPGQQIRRSADGLYPQEVLAKMINDNDFCRNYEDPEFGGRGTWRTPNQVELALMLTLTDDSEFRISNTASGTSATSYKYLSSTYWYRNQEIADMGSTAYESVVKDININGVTKRQYTEMLGARADGEGRKTSLIGAGDLYENQHFSVRCVRDTDKDGNYAGNPEYGNPVDFDYGTLTATYNDDGTANYSVNSTIGNHANVTSVSVTIDGVTSSAPSVSGDTYTSNMVGTPVASQAKVIWTITTTEGATLKYSRSYTLPARYWMISNYNYQNRYATVNIENGQTTVGAADNRNADQIEAIYKWVLTKSTGTIVNESELNTTDTYYLYNAGAQTFIDRSTGTNANHMKTGNNAIPVKLQTRSGYDGYYVIRLNNATNANRNGGANYFGVWNGTDDGSTYKLTPAVMKGEMPLRFVFANDYSVSGSTYSVSIETDTDVVIGNVTIAGLTATVTGSNGHFTATVNGSTISASASTIETVWNLTKGSESYVRRRTYDRHVKYYVISSEVGPQQYAYADAGTNRTAADATPYTGNVTDLDANHQWIFATNKAAAGVEPVNANVFADLSASYYMYNKGTGKYITGPLVSGSSYFNTHYGYLTIGDAEDRMRVRLEGKANGKYSFLFPHANINNHCITTYKRSGNNWAIDAAIFGIFQAGDRNAQQFRFIVTPIYE